jgi:hypothetical protein
MKVRLAYGETGMEIDVPADRTVVVTPRQMHAVADERRGARCAAETDRRATAPRARPARADGRDLDVRRHSPQPRHVMIPAVLDELEGIVDPDDVVVLVATGTHRGNTPDELEAMLGPDVLGRVRVVNHDARDDASLRWCGEVLDVPVWLNRSGSTPTSGSPPDSSSRTSSQASVAGRS